MGLVFKQLFHRPIDTDDVIIWVWSVLTADQKQRLLTAVHTINDWGSGGDGGVIIAG